MRRTKCVSAIAGIIAGLMTPTHLAIAQPVAPPQSESFKQTYGEWGGQWWQYVLGIPDKPAPEENPLNDPNGERCSVGNGAQYFSSSEQPEEAPHDRARFPLIPGYFSRSKIYSAQSPKMETRLRRLPHFAQTL
jgi:hypothetical protein